MSMEQNLNEFIEELIQEIEQELEEATTSGNVAGYNTPFAFGTNRKKDKKKEKETATQAGYTLAEGMVPPKRGHEFFQLTKNTPIRYIKGKEGMGLEVPGVLIKNLDGYIDGKKGAYLIDYFGAAFYVDLKKKFASKIYPIKDQDKLSWNSNFIDVDKAPQMSDWKKYLKESVNEAIKGRNNKTGETFGMVIGSDKKNREGDFEVTVRKSYSSRIESFKFVFDKNSNLIEVHDYGYSKDGKFPDMGGRSSVKSIRPDKRETITQIAKITSPAFAKKIYQHVQKNNKMDESVNEAKVKRPVNRWLELKNDDTMHPHKKMAMGLKELKYQLKEVEKFFSWYNKIKTMNELDSQNYWKRTNNHIYKIKERLINIAKTIQEIEKWKYPKID